MAFLFRPVAVKPVPPNAEKCKGKRAVRWKSRTGDWIEAQLTKDGGKCRVRSPVWWVEFRDANGKRCREKVSRDRKAAEHRMAQIVQDVERQKGGLLPVSSTPSGETLTALAKEYKRHLEDLGRSPQHAIDTHRRIVAVLKDCRWHQAKDVTLSRWVRWVGDARRGEDPAVGGFRAETINHYLRSLRAFFRWQIRMGRLAADPLAGAELLNADADRSIRRRVLSPTEFRRLIDSTGKSDESRIFLRGPDRAALYLLAARTGLRAGVLAKLTPESLRLDDPTPHIPVEARRQKSRKELRVPIPKSVVAELRTWLSSRKPGRLLWPGNWHRHGHASGMVRADLRAAGLPKETPDGGYDFHSLRGQCATDLALAGVPLSVTQQYLGHSTPTLTAKHYVHVGLADLGAAADRLGSS